MSRRRNGRKRRKAKRETVPAIRATEAQDNWPFWESAGYGGISDAGIPVTRDNALTLASVWGAVSMIEADVAKLPLNLYEYKENGDKEVYDRYETDYLVSCEANYEMTSRMFWRQLMGDVLLFNNAYAFIGRGGDGRPQELIPLLPDRTRPWRRTSTSELVYRTSVETGYYWLDPYDVLHLRGMMFSNYRDRHINFLYYAREVLGLALAAQEFESTFFKNGMRTTGILNIPDDMPKTAGDNLAKSFRAQYENRRGWFRSLILREGAEFQAVQGQTMRDSQTKQLREDQVRDIARLFKLPPSKLGLEDSVSYNSKADDNRQYYETTLWPWLDMIQDECWFKLLLRGERRKKTYRFEHDVSQLLRLDKNSRYQAYAVGIQNKFLLPNEVRELEGLPTIAKLDDAILNPQPMPFEQPQEEEEAGETQEEERKYGRHEKRDKWLLQNRHKYTLRELSEKLFRKKDFSPIGPRGIQKAIIRYKKFHGLEASSSK